MKPHRSPSRACRARGTAVLLALAAAFAPFAALADAATERTPRGVIEALGPEVRRLLATPRPDRSRADAERDAAARIAALIASSPGHLQLTTPDARGRTPLMLAVSGGYLPVVRALLTDASVRLQINEVDKDGVSAWMLANFVPGATLVACQPGTLTRSRAPLLMPYLRRMGDLLGDNAATPIAIVQALQDAGAEVRPDDARRAWLDQCPNAEPALRESLQQGALMQSLLAHTIKALSDFNRQARDNPALLPATPPAGMQFNAVHDGPDQPPMARFHDLICPVAPSPTIGMIRWTGTMLFKVVAATRAGVVEVVDIEVERKRGQPSDVVDHFRQRTLHALANYECLGDLTFEQEFQYVIR